MRRIKILPVVFICILSHSVNSQIIEIKGQVRANSDLEGIHVLNKTSKYYSITNKNGAFSIKVKLSDTIVFSSVLYKLVSIEISEENLLTRFIKIDLQEFVNRLDEVLIGNTLSGNLENDVQKVKGKPDINFYDVGIPGYTGKPKTKRERELYEADHGNFFIYYGIGFAINVNKILNRVSGRTKKLKNRVKLEKKDELMYRLKSEFSHILFKGSELTQENQMNFFYFCSEEDDFLKKGGLLNEFAVFQYLEERLRVYKAQAGNLDD